MANLKSVIIPPTMLRELVLKLWKRSRELKNEEEIVTKSDPYMQPGRVKENAEFTDDTVEDIEKTIQQARLNIIQAARLEIRKALAKVRIGTYGICETCKSPIDLSRLKAFPQATKCLDCSRKAEDE